jgi:hypothetical protein
MPLTGQTTTTIRKSRLGNTQIPRILVYSLTSGFQARVITEILCACIILSHIHIPLCAVTAGMHSTQAAGTLTAKLVAMRSAPRSAQAVGTPLGLTNVGPATVYTGVRRNRGLHSASTCLQQRRTAAITETLMNAAIRCIIAIAQTRIHGMEPETRRGERTTTRPTSWATAMAESPRYAWRAWRTSELLSGCIGRSRTPPGRARTTGYRSTRIAAVPQEAHGGATGCASRWAIQAFFLAGLTRADPATVSSTRMLNS